MSNTTAKPPALDRLIGYVSPKWAAQRAYYRAASDSIPSFDAVYRGGLATRLDTQWSTSLGYTGANSPLNRWRLTKLRDRARDMERNNAIACGMLDRTVENVVGHGFRLQATTTDTDFNKRAEELWNDWTPYADIRGMSSWAEFQRLIFRSYLRDGDVGVALVQRGNDVKLQAISGDQIDTKNGGYDGKQNIVDGIQFNNVGRPIAFNVLAYGLDGQRDEAVVIANDFIYLARMRTLNQVRGEPCFAQVFKLFDQIDGFIEAVVVAARIAACQGLLIKTADAGKSFKNLATATNSQGNGQALATMEPGMVRYLQPGEEVTQVNPTQPQQHFPDFVSQLLRFAGVTLGLPLELVMLDFSRTNYSSARASLLQAYRSFKTLQQQFSDLFLARAYRWRISKWVKDGTLEVPDAIAGSYWKHNFLPPGWAWIDPVKEIQAAMMEVDAGLNTLTNIAAQHGMEWLEIVEKRKSEIEAMNSAGVPSIHSSLTRDPLAQPAPTGPSNATDDGDGDTVDPQADSN